jgi:diaminohydroxyphosphoribosylaminopyrimidine deaminase / 5-amino-6-(5-phosphoribosylamino)uracil reductase
MTIAEQYLQRCLQLAAMGKADARPNPAVGAVLVHQNTIIGEGYTQPFGGAHAEVVCINSVQPEQQHLIQQATLYVSLEPCNHFGKTPPCANLIVQKGIRKVVVGCIDPFGKVKGNGVETLRKAGVEVELGVLEVACQRMNREFFSLHVQEKPYIILKWAQTADGYLAKDHFEQLPISNECTNRLVHQWRSEAMAIMVGTNTAIADDPQLTTRWWPGKNPLRLVVDKTLKIPPFNKLLNDGQPTVVFNQQKEASVGAVEYHLMDDNFDLIDNVIAYCCRHEISSLLVEGGSALLNSFLHAGKWDELRIITNQSMRLPHGLEAPLQPYAQFIDRFHIGSDCITMLQKPNDD